MANGKQESKTPVIKEKVAMDARKFLSAINGSAQAQIAFYEDAVQRLGGQNGQEWELTALQGSRIIFEDVATNTFMVADHSREKGGRVKISNIRRIELHEDKKPELFEQACLSLVEAIEGGDVKVMDAAFNKVAASRFRSTTIPPSGIVKTKDGMVRCVAVEGAKSLGERIVDQLSDKYTIDESGNIEASFVEKDDGNWDFGVSELTTRRLVAKNMLEVAAGAYRSPNFQAMVEAVGGLICKDRIEEAIKYSSKFLRENQEFCLLSKARWADLVGDALAAKLHFNENLVEDVTTLMFKTNLKVNHDELVDAWRKTAERAGHPVMLENVDNLSEADDFEEAYEEFLGTIIEATGETTRGALLAGLELLQQKVASGDVDDPTAEELEGAISNLRDKGDSASIWEAMEILDSVRRHTDKMQGLDDFDQMPGPGSDSEIPEGEEDMGGDLDIGANAGGSDKPLEITIAMDPAKMAASAAAEAEPDLGLGEEGEEGGDEFNLSSLEDIDLEGEEEGLKGGGEEEGGEEEDELAALAAGKETNAEPISEFLTSEGIVGEKWSKPWEDNDDDDDDEDDTETIAYNQTGERVQLDVNNRGKLSSKPAPKKGKKGKKGKKAKKEPAMADSVNERAGDDQRKPWEDDEIRHQRHGAVDGKGRHKASEDEAKEDEDWHYEHGSLPKDKKDKKGKKDKAASEGIDDDAYALPEGVELEGVGIDPEYSTLTEADEASDVDLATFEDFLGKQSDWKGDEADIAALDAQAQAFARSHYAEQIQGMDEVAAQDSVEQLAGSLITGRTKLRSEKPGVENKETDEDAIEENQFKSPLRQLSKRGLKRAAVDELVKEGKLSWVERNKEAVLGEFKGVKFVIDHGEQPVAVLSQDGKVQVDIPEGMVPGALFIAEISEKEAEADAFVEWLDSIIESLRSDEGAIEDTEGEIDVAGQMSGQSQYSYIQVYIDARQSQEGADVYEPDFWAALRAAGINVEGQNAPGTYVSSWADADRDGYTVTVRVVSPLPPSAENLAVDMSDTNFEIGVSSHGEWPGDR